MRTVFSCLLAGVLLCVHGGPACAATSAESGNFPAVLSASGDVSCAEFIEDQRANGTAINPVLMNLFAVWVWRFLSDYDHRESQAGGQVDLPDKATVLSFLRHFCEHNPLGNVYSGTVALLKSRQRSGLESKQAVIVGRLRVRRTRRRRAGVRA